MRAQEFIIENADPAAVSALQKKHGWSTGTTVNGDLYFTWQGLTYVFYGERMRINVPNTDRSISVVWGKKPDWQGRGNDEISFAQAVQQKILKFDLSIWQQLDRGQINDNQALQKFKAENERQAREALAQGVTEGQEQCPKCGGAMFSELLINEKQDACYYKVKSRYKVWPSAYASGALVQCRKKGAANWGNKK